MRRTCFAYFITCLVHHRTCLLSLQSGAHHLLPSPHDQYRANQTSVHLPVPQLPPPHKMHPSWILQGRTIYQPESDRFFGQTLGPTSIPDAPLVFQILVG